MLDDLTSHHANVFKKHSWQNNNEVQVVQICTFLQAHNPRGSASPEFFQVLKKKTTQICFAYLAETGLELQVVQNKRAAHSCWSPPPSGRRRGQSEERCWSVRGLGSVDLQPRMCSCLPSARCQRCSHHLPLTEAPLRAPQRLCSQRSARLTPTAKQHRAHSDGWIYKLEASQFF